MSSVNKAISIDEVWGQVSKPFRDILSNVSMGLTSASYMNLYTVVFKYVSSMNADNSGLYTRFVDLLKRRTAELVKEAHPLPDEELLLFFVKKWDDWAAVTKVLNHIMAYLNRTWVKTQRSSATNSTVYEISMTADVVWRDHMLVGGLKERLGEAMLRLISSERNGNSIQPHLIRNCLNCFVRMGLNRENPQNPTLEVYKAHFERKFLEETEVYYTGEAMRVLHESGVTAFMKRIEQRLQEEVDRVERYLNPCTQKPLVECLERVLIATHKDALHAKFVELMRNDATEDVRRMYALLSRVEAGLEPLKVLLEQFIRTVGQDAILAEKKEASEKPDVFVTILLRVFRKYTDLNNVAFRNDPGFVLALDKAFRDFVNKNAVTEEEGGADSDKAMAKAPQILAKYCDSILRKGSTIGEEEMERTQNDIVSLFKYFPDKDVFMMVYSKLLSKRLISELSASEDAESAMITKLKAAQGFEYTMKLQRMVTDMSVSKDINKDFQEFCSTSAGGQLKFSFNVFVLATGSWPLQAPPTPFNVPPTVGSAVDLFKTYYDKKYQGRKLNYLHHLSRAELEMRTARGPYRLTTTTYQMGVMMMFSDATGPLRLREIQSRTLLQEAMLKQSLWPLVKLKILVCPDGLNPDAWRDETTFEFNAKFANAKKKLSTIPGPSAAGQGAAAQAAQAAEKDEESADVMRDRVLKLQAAIVRVMKARITLSYNELIPETIDQVSKWFSPKVPAIKKAIESLIDQEFIKRGKDLKTFQYIA